MNERVLGNLWQIKESPSQVVVAHLFQLGREPKPISSYYRIGHQLNFILIWHGNSESYLLCQSYSKWSQAIVPIDRKVNIYTSAKARLYF